MSKMSRKSMIREDITNPKISPIKEFNFKLGLDGAVGIGAGATISSFADCFKFSIVFSATNADVSAKVLEFSGELVLAVIIKISVLFTNLNVTAFFISLGVMLKSMLFLTSLKNLSVFIISIYVFTIF